MQTDPCDLKIPNPLAGVRVIRLATVPFFLVTQLQQQAEQLAAAGMHVLLVSAEGPELARLKTGPNLCHRVIPFARAISPLRDLMSLWALMRLIRKERPEILHSTTPKAGLLSAIAGFLLRVPVRLHTFTGQPWVTLSGPVRYVTRAADRLICRLNTRVYADSHSQRRFLIDEGIVSTGKIAVLGAGSLAGVDLQRFNRLRWTEQQKSEWRQRHGIAPGAKIIIFVGRLAREKGIFELIEAFQRLIDSGTDCHLLLVGPHDSEVGGQSRDLEENLSERVHLTGYTDCPERYLAMADVMCLPSYREGFGTVVIEAAAMGVPTVGTTINGLRDAVVDGKTGVLVEPRSAEALYQALSGLMADPDRLASMGNAAREHVIAHYGLDQITRMLMTEYGWLMNMSGQAAGKTGGAA